MSFISKIFGDSDKKFFEKLRPTINKINSFEPEFEKIPDEELKFKTEELKKKLKAEGKERKTLDDILPEAFALVRESSKRTLGQRHFDVQMMGGIVLHQGKIAEMKTGEGKTLAATLPLYLNALEGKGAHLVTVNDYLARRDMVWMGQIYHLLGLSVGCLNHDQAFLYDPEYKKAEEEEDKTRDEMGSFMVVEDFLRPVSRKEAYAADITYGTNNEFGFDYLRDNMVYDLKDKVQRELNFSIIDEVDSILIDEARTPLIISGPSEGLTEKYYQFAKLTTSLKKDEDYIIDEKLKAATFTEKGQIKVVKILGNDPWADNDIATTHQLESALKAKALFEKDRDYVVKEGKIIIVDEFTGRLMPGRRWSGGIHQAIEAKEGLSVKEESLTLATITFQNYFRMYKKLSGMTGTAVTSAEEFDKVYKLEVLVVPTNKPLIRKDLPDRIYKTLDGKFKSLVREIGELHKKGQPVLVGTVSIEKNEYLGKLLEREGIPHQILNAKQHEREGEIIAQAGSFGAVTIATNMAGRGVDIILGGNPPNKEEQEKVIALGGLHIIGTERHEARRIDNQLRGRAGRQGDPGSSQFFVSLEDDLMRIFGSEKIKSIMDTFKIPEDQPLEANMISKAIESSQSKVEGFNFDARKYVLDYDDVMNKHRETFYKKREEILERAEKGTLREEVLEMARKSGFSDDEYERKEKEVGSEQMRQLERIICLKVLDTFWIEHLENMAQLKDSVKLRAYGQRDPLVEYKTEGHKMFKQLLQMIESTIANTILKTKLQPSYQAPAEKPVVKDFIEKEKIAERKNISQKGSKKIGRNDPCPCGSGKKYKNCCWPKYGY